MENSGNFEVHTMNDLKESNNLSSSNNSLKNFSPIVNSPSSRNNFGSASVGVDFQNDLNSEESKKRRNKIIIMISGIVFLLILIILGYLGYTGKISFLSFLKKEEVKQEENKDVESDIVKETEVEKETKNRYSDELSNYLMIDTESENIFNNIQQELNIIKTNLPEQNFTQPISFIVTNKKNQPISFSDFSVYANMNIPTDILLTLDDKFEIYAYDDFSAGVRFGLKIEIKNETNLKKSLEIEERNLVNSFAIFFENSTIDTSKNLEFKNSQYNNYTIKYVNLNETNTNSIDYIINKNNWLIGTSKQTFRAILDKIDKENINETNLNLNLNNSSNNNSESTNK